MSPIDPQYLAELNILVSDCLKIVLVIEAVRRCAAPAARRRQGPQRLLPRSPLPADLVVSRRQDQIYRTDIE
jgi:hypothetical protein